MIQALLAGRKTQTRRALKLPTKTHSGGPIYERPDMGGWAVTTHGGEGCFAFGKAGERLPVPERAGLWHQTTGTCVAAQYAVGDRLWVKETWRTSYALDYFRDDLGRCPRPTDMDPATTAIEYLADGERELGGKTRVSIHMPRWASRLTLLVDDVRVERLQDISEADAIAEGASCYICETGKIDGTSENECGCFHNRSVAVPSYQALWNAINGPGAWDANPWVVAVTFRVVRENIDRLPVNSSEKGMAA